MDTEITLPNITYYVYPSSDFLLTRGPNSTCDHTKISAKHGAAHFAFLAMEQHPWRTLDPLQADMAIIPTAVDLWSRGWCERVSQSDLEKELELAIQKSPIFPNKRHVLIANDFMSYEIADRLLSILDPAGVHVGMEGRGECRTSTAYTSNYAVYSEKIRRPRNPNLSSHRKYSIHMVGSVGRKKAYRERLALYRSGNYPLKPFPPSPFITTKKTKEEDTSLWDWYLPIRQCLSLNDTDRCLSPSTKYLSRIVTQKAQESSNYTLALRGDTPGSDRWINGMAAGTALVQVANDNMWDGYGTTVQKATAWLPYPCAIPWDNFVLTIPRSDFLRDPAGELTRLVDGISAKRLEDLQRLSWYYTADVDWGISFDRVLENLAREAYYIPCPKFERQDEQRWQEDKLKPLLEQDWCVANQALAQKRAWYYLKQVSG